MNLKNSITKTIAYFNLFDFPLTAEEILENLYGYNKPIHIKEIKGTLEQMVDDAKLEKIQDYYIIKGRNEILETKKTRKFIAEKFWNRVKIYGQYLKSVPFVKMVAVCNNLAYDNPSETSDIDLFIVIKSGRMWTSRLITTLILHFFGVRRYGKHIAGRFCLSFFITEKKLSMNELELKPEDPYLAYWTKLLTPIYGEEMYENFKTHNSKWLKEKYGLKFSDNSKRHMFVENGSKIKRFFEYILNGKIGDLLENFLKKIFKKRTLHKMKHLGPEASVIVNDDILKFHNHDRRAEYLEKWKKII